ncbi:MAG: winged helix-turn-helix transcriptional regulator, partial [Proteobacteria bacterium]|nr:winged helix-turn-helix transcriptional regulator [Pseudomonadota bacterium]
MDPLLGVPIALPPPGRGTLTRALQDQLRAAIVDGRLRPGTPLPSTRALAAACRIARNTVIAAYDRLLGEGYLVARRGAGTAVAAVVPTARPPRAARPGAGARLL